MVLIVGVIKPIRDFPTRSVLCLERTLFLDRYHGMLAYVDFTFSKLDLLHFDHSFHSR